MGYTDFNDMNISASTAREVSIVNIEIVGPLEDLSPRVLRDVFMKPKRVGGEPALMTQIPDAARPLPSAPPSLQVPPDRD